MHAKTYIIAAGLAALNPVAADFKVYVGASNDFAAGAPGGAVNAQTPQAYFFNNPPDCKDKGGVLQVNGNNDVSKSGGFVCDDCDASKALKDQVPTRFEVHDDGADIFANGGDDVHFSTFALYFTDPWRRSTRQQVLFTNEWFYSPLQRQG